MDFDADMPGLRVGNIGVFQTQYVSRFAVSIETQRLHDSLRHKVSRRHIVVVTDTDIMGRSANAGERKRGARQRLQQATLELFQRQGDKATTTATSPPEPALPNGRSSDPHRARQKL